ncbi:DUF2891 family protein [Psychromonas aquimarina]|uniref:DUF2891 family protein n=1 Tax=Psychromonas aquimarina TaxID=444919 RepID=UPI00048C9010|nr:DUF2891 family protein [Psychromonas aquimarina]
METKARRNTYVFDLLVPIQSCVRRQDTKHVLFHGCVDWHSSVHGVWALTAASRLTNSDKLHKFVKSQLTPNKIKAERNFLKQNPEFEMPYGRAWFLRLAIEFNMAYDDNRLKKFADEVADSLVKYFNNHSILPLSDSYTSASWALINLRSYGIASGRKELIDFVDQLVSKHFIVFNQPCPLDSDKQNRSFMAGCTNWAWLVSEVLEKEEYKVWINRFIPNPELINPIQHSSSSHMYGLNFSRAWGLWRIYLATKDERWLRLYIEHFEFSIQRPSWWAGNYQTVGHWVAQFGMFALIPLFEPTYD